MSRDVRFNLLDAAATEALGGRLACCCPAPMTIFLRGDLGAGKTTLVRGFLRARGYEGPVTSPTYTLVEPYDVDPPVYHFDLYRLGDPEELEFLGARDYFGGYGLCLVEWPEKGDRALPPPDVEISLSYEDSGRRALLSALTGTGQEALRCISNNPT